MPACRRAKITALGTYVPPRILSNKDLETMVETTDQWILERTGIRERHIADKGVAASDLAVEAVKNLLKSHPFDLQEVDLIVVGTVTPDMMYPSTACLVQHKLGIARTWGFDVSAGCSGFLYALNTGVTFIESGAYKKVLVIGSDVNSIDGELPGPGGLHHLRRWRRRRIAGTRRGRRRGHHRSRCPSRGRWRPVFMHARGREFKSGIVTKQLTKKMHYIHQDGQQVFKYAVKKMAEMTERILKGNKLTGSDIDCFIAHQANRRIIMATADRLKMPEDKVIVNIDRYGNTTAGTIPLAMQTALENGKLKKGNLVLVAAVGAGFTSGATLLRWAY